MVKHMRDFLRKVLEIILYGSKRDSKSYINYLKKQGVSIGSGTVFYEPLTNVIDTTTPKLLTIGENVRITRGVVILTHDYSWSVLAGVYGECLGGIAPVTIRNNVFIGMDSHILKGVTIGDNVIIGTGSVVTKDCESNSVYAGNPARRIMSLEDFYEKRKHASLEEAKAIARIYKTEPFQNQKSALREFSTLFSSKDDPVVLQLMKDTGYEEKCMAFYANKVPQFADMEEFIRISNLQ